MSSAFDSLPTSPDGVITYMGRTYEVKDLFPSLDVCAAEEDNSNSSDAPPPPQFKRETSGKKAAVSHIDRRRRPPRRTHSNVERQAPLSPIRRPASRCKSSSEIEPPSAETLRRMAPPSRRVTPGRSRSGSALTSMIQALQVSNSSDQEDDDAAAAAAAAACQVPPPPARNLTRARSLGEAANSVRNLFAGQFHEEEEDYGIHSTSMRRLQYNQADVNGIIGDQKEFERLKATLKKKGAITNEVLKQGLHFYVKAKKDRDAGILPPAPKRRSRGDRMRRSRSDAHKAEGQCQQQDSNNQPLMRRGTTGEINYEKKIGN